MRLVLLLSLISITFSAFAREDVAISMVPRGKLSKPQGLNYIITTLAGTDIEISFSKDGKLHSAQGKNLNKGDELEPGDGLMALSSVAQGLRLKSSALEGLWKLKSDKSHGWVYEFSDKMVVNAKNGKIIHPRPKGL